MYAIVELGGRQWKVEPGARLEVNRLPEAVGAQHVVDRVLFAQTNEQLQVGRPYVADAKVICEVVEHRLGPKTIAYHYRRRENWRKTRGHRQPLTRLVVKDIVLGASGSGTVPDPVKKKPASRPKKKEAKHGA
jgi:large subunit ribosomal protein L21